MGLACFAIDLGKLAFPNHFLSIPRLMFIDTIPSFSCFVSDGIRTQRRLFLLDFMAFAHGLQVGKVILWEIPLRMQLSNGCFFPTKKSRWLTIHMFLLYIVPSKTVRKLDYQRSLCGQEGDQERIQVEDICDY